MTTYMNIASLEDDPTQAQLIHNILTDAGYLCTSFLRGKDLLATLSKTHPYDLLLLDWEVPDLTGLDIVRWVRTTLGNSIPVMFLTSRIDEEDLVVGLQAGADDYVGKPIRSKELLARIQALLRRQQAASNKDRSFRCGAYEIDSVNSIISLQGETLVLSPKEYELAVLFFRNPDRLFSRDVLSINVWNREIPATSRTIDTHLSNIRRKLQLRPEHGVRLNASYALGYRLELISEESESA